MSKKRINVRSNHWPFFLGFRNDFDVIRIGLDWLSYDRANLSVMLMGFGVSINFRAQSVLQIRHQFLTWVGPCSECGRRFGRHRPDVEHLPF